MENATGNADDKLITENLCGCKVIERHSIITGETRTIIQYCPIHNASPNMYEALKTLIEDYQYVTKIVASDALEEAKKALAKAEGKV